MKPLKLSALVLLVGYALYACVSMVWATQKRVEQFRLTGAAQNCRQSSGRCNRGKAAVSPRLSRDGKHSAEAAKRLTEGSASGINCGFFKRVWVAAFGHKRKVVIYNPDGTVLCSWSGAYQSEAQGMKHHSARVIKGTFIIEES